jgi:hypothetical protein
MQVRLLTAFTITIVMATAGAARADEPVAGTPAATPAEGTPPPTAATTASATDVAAMFGLAGQIVISGELQAQFVHTSINMMGPSGNTIVFQPALDYFVAPNITVGGFLTFQMTSLSANGFSVDQTNVGLGARGGYNIHLTPMLSAWATLGLSYLHSSQSTTGMATQSGYTVPLEIFIPLLIHPTPHLFVGLGPILHTDLISKVGSADGSKETDIGVSSIVGGYFGGV